MLDEAVISDDYVIVCAGSRYLDYAKTDEGVTTLIVKTRHA